MSAGASFAVINGQKLHPDSGQVLDSLTSSNAVAMQPDSNPALHVEAQQAKPARPTTRTIDGLAGPIRKLPTSTKKPVPVTPAPVVKHVVADDKPAPVTEVEAPATVQTRRLTTKRTQRASQYQQHHAISKFGSTKHDQRGKTTAPESEPNVATYLPNEELAVKSVIQQLYRPIQPISKYLHHFQPNDADEAGDKSSDKQSWLLRLVHSQRTLKIATASLSVLLLSGYVAYLNAPNISLRVAANRAGIEAELPDYTPSGFGLSGPVEYSQGQVVLNFATKSDQRNFQIKQEASPWDSESLRENAVANETSDYQTVERRGLTIYIFNESNATWVNQGIRYTLTGNSQLSDDQITNIATSL